MNEQFYEKLLNINTSKEQKGFNKSFHYHRYEPTPYSALEILFNQYQLKSSDHIVDFGCGKGRLNFYIHYLYDAFVTGIEMNELFYQEAVENQKNYFKRTKKRNNKIQFHCCLAEEYRIDALDNYFYFFNPFSIQIFMKIINNILLSLEKSKREITLVLYYGSDDYIYYLENQTAFELMEEVKLPGLYEHNPYERFLIYKMKGF